MVFTLISALTYITGCTVPQVVTNPDGSTSTNHVVDPRITTAITTAGAVNVATAPVNPFTVPIEIGLSALAAGFAWFAKRKNDQHIETRAQLVSVIRAVDDHGDVKVKEAIQKQAEADGTGAALHKNVKAVDSGLI